jgi:hypothetical protein
VQWPAQEGRFFGGKLQEAIKIKKKSASRYCTLYVWPEFTLLNRRTQRLTVWPLSRRLASTIPAGVNFVVDSHLKGWPELTNRFFKTTKFPQDEVRDGKIIENEGGLHLGV